MDEEMVGIDFHTVDEKTADEMLRLDGCIFGKNYLGVRCLRRETCYKCGWNPHVAAQRRYKTRKEFANAEDPA